jgi:GDP-mannose 4,6 dehydratase
LSTLINRDITEGLDVGGPVEYVFHLASPASPADYLRFPVQTLKAGSAGTIHALELARKERARFVLASSSEVYGDPLEHPQPESYWGNVNPIGPRRPYDEAKRFAEATTAAYARTYGVSTAIARVFNSYGPRMRPGRSRAACCGIRGHIADCVRAVRTVGDTVGFPRTATDGPRRRRVSGLTCAAESSVHSRVSARRPGGFPRAVWAGKGGAPMSRAVVRESVTLAGRAERARVARAFVEAVLGPGHPCGDVAVLLVGELFGNSVRYSRSGARGR